MESSTVSGLRSRSRSKTPFLRSSCDRESCTGGEEHALHKSGRKTPVKRSTPVKQLHKVNHKGVSEVISELEEEYTDPPAHRTRQSTRSTQDKIIKTSDYSSDENLDRLKGNGKEILQNEINNQFERVTTSTYTYSTLADLTLSPIHASHNVTKDRSMRFGSPAYSACSTDSSFAEQALADAGSLLDKDSSIEHLPYRLYKMAGEYWNKYPKTDYTYSPLSKDRVELAPGQVAVPNMSRRSLSQFRIQGPNTSADEVDLLATSTAKRWRRTAAMDSSDDESQYRYLAHEDDRWWITRLVVTIITTITTTVTTAYRNVVGPSHRYPYTERRPAKAGIVSRAASALAAPFIWIYTTLKKVVTTTVTTITETITPNHVDERESYAARRQEKAAKRSWLPLILLFLIPFIGYGCYNYPEYLPQDNVIDSYKPPVVEDAELSKRVAALEKWSQNVGTKLSSIDLKLSQFDNLEEQIEQYSLTHLQRNLVQIFNVENTGDVGAKLKGYFDQHYITKDEMQKISQDIHERLIISWEPGIGEDKIREMIQQYLSVFERKQLEVILERVKEYVRKEEVRVVHTESGFDADAVRRIVAGMLDIYDADKTGMVDYALESAGGQILSTRCTELYQIKTKQYSILGVPVWWVFTSPRHALTPGAMPAECWAFQGFPGYLVVKTYAIIEVTGFSLEHMSRLLAVEGKIESAPKNFSVYGLHGELDPDPHLFGEYQYDDNGTSIQYFPVKYPKTTNIGGVEYPVAYDIIELRVESNHGNPTYTCVYRFRVHGNPLSDIRQATDDSIRDSET